MAWKVLDLKIDDPDFTYSMNFIVKIGDYGPILS